MANHAIEAVLEAERRGALFEQRVLGYPVWPLERLRRYRNELLDGKLVESTGPSAPLARRLKAMQAPLAQSLRDARTLAVRRALSQRDIWVLSASNYRRADAHGVAQCIFAEDLRSQLGARVVFIERIANDLLTPPREDVLHFDALHTSAMLSAKALGPVVAATGVVSAAQKAAFAPLSPAYVAQLALYGQAMQRFAAWLIAQHRPKAVFVLCGYQPHVPFQRALRAAGVPLVELQHGLIHESHPGYALGDGDRCDHLPERLIAFGPRFAKMTEAASGYWRGRTVIGGHPWLREKRRGAPPLEQRDALVFFSQTDVPVREALKRLARGTAELFEQQGKRLRLVVKPHPRETDSESYWGDLRALGVEVAPLHSDGYAILRECRMAISVYSTVAVEALAFGCTSLVTHPALWTDDIRALVEEGCLVPAEDPQDVLRALELPPQRNADLADELFAVNKPALDYAALIDELARAAGRG